MKYSIILRGLAIIWTIVMLIGCLTPLPQLPGPVTDINDKLMHVVIFAPFSLLWILSGFRLNSVLIAGFLFGGLIELLQYALPVNRTGDWIDLFADCVGTVVGAALALAWYRLFPHRNF
ncbi:VanZ family protein [Spirosoma validum]|uniref:VanZ family protein n=1 Tax=Spirosoma validum TaxID=2771355 RepID=A0A927B887_9BACT|nr:VanZ family protein [Spirosoma validum]MBD2757535.1 VanZ family protein [Spirosoma validum]